MQKDTSDVSNFLNEFFPLDCWGLLETMRLLNQSRILEVFSVNWVQCFDPSAADSHIFGDDFCPQSKKSSFLSGCMKTTVIAAGVWCVTCRYCAGTMPWGNTGDHRDFEPQRHDDGCIEVIGFTMASLVRKTSADRRTFMFY